MINIAKLYRENFVKVQRREAHYRVNYIFILISKFFIFSFSSEVRDVRSEVPRAKYFQSVFEEKPARLKHQSWNSVIRTKTLCCRFLS